MNAASVDRMIAALEAAMLANPLTVSVTVDGQAVTFASLADRDRTYQFWLRQKAILGGTRKRMVSMNLGGGRR